MRNAVLTLILVSAGAGCSAIDEPKIGSVGEEINPCPINNSLPVTPQGTVKPDICDCEPSPILIDVKGNGFALTDAAAGVRFDIRDVGVAEQIGWPEPGSDDAFLALDRNGDGVINSGAELFGNAAEQPASAKYANGYNALSVFDDNGDGVVDENDPIYPRLLLWQDSNHDGVSQPQELHGLAEMGVAGLSVRYTVSKKADSYGNQFHYRADVYGTPGSHVGRYSYDVFPAVEGMDVGEDGAVNIDRELAKTVKVAPQETCGGGMCTNPDPTQCAIMLEPSTPIPPSNVTCYPATHPAGTPAKCAACPEPCDSCPNNQCMCTPLQCKWACSGDNSCYLADTCRYTLLKCFTL